MSRPHAVRRAASCLRCSQWWRRSQQWRWPHPLAQPLVPLAPADATCHQLPSEPPSPVRMGSGGGCWRERATHELTHAVLCGLLPVSLPNTSYGERLEGGMRGCLRRRCKPCKPTKAPTVPARHCMRASAAAPHCGCYTPLPRRSLQPICSEHLRPTRLKKRLARFLPIPLSSLELGHPSRPWLSWGT